MRHSEQVALTPNGPAVSRLGLGASVIDGREQPAEEDDALAVIAAALAAGISYVDTAPLYGLGRSERRVGRVLADVPRDSVTVSTKIGRLLRENDERAERLPHGMWPDSGSLAPVFDFSRDGVLRSLEESRARLELERVDVVFVHDPHDYLEEAIGVAVPVLVELREQGVIGAIGVGMDDVDALTRFVGETDIDCILLAGRYTLLDQSASTALLPLCEQRGVAVVAGGVFNSGVLGDPSAGARYDYVPASREHVERARAIGAVCAAHGASLQAAALQFPARHAAVRSVLTGVRSLAELTQNIGAFDSDLPAGLWDELTTKGLLPSEPALTT